MEALEGDPKGVEQTYGDNMLNLTLARGYIKKLLENGMREGGEAPEWQLPRHPVGV